MRETRSYGSEGGESGTTGLPYPYRFLVISKFGVTAAQRVPNI
jgi:hypothetical protein